MTVYDDLIGEKILSLQAVVASKRKEIDEINRIIVGLYAVKQEEDAPIIDQFTGEEMPEERRQEIYDNCMAKAINILETE